MVILEIQFILPPDEDIKKRPKPKGLLPEEIKHIYTVSWIDYYKLNSTPWLKKHKKSLIKNCLILIVRNIKNYIQNNENKFESKNKNNNINYNNNQNEKIVMNIIINISLKSWNLYPFQNNAQPTI